MWKRIFLYSATLLLLAVVLPQIAQEQAGMGADPTALTGSGPGAQGRTADMASLPQIPPSITRKTRVAMPLGYGFKRNATQPGVGPINVSGEASPVPVALSVEATPSAAPMFLGQDETGCGSGGLTFTPSDNALATSQTSSPFVVHVLNSCIAVYNNLGKLYSGFPKSLDSFFGVGTDMVGYPHALYDQLWNHFIVVAEDSTANTILVAASSSSNPTGTWNIYSFSAGSYGTGACADFPMLGQTEREIGDPSGGIYVSYDELNCSTGAFVDDVVLILPKSPIYAGTPTGTINEVYGFSYAGFGGYLDHVQPANVSNRADRPRAEFLLSNADFNAGCVYPSACNGLVVWAIYNGVWFSGTTGPNLSSVEVPTANNYYQPVSAGQPGAASGTSCAVDAGPVGITGGVTWSAGDLFAAITTQALSGQASDGWIYWQVHPYLSDTSPPTLSSATIRNEVGWGTSGFGNSTYSEYYPTPQPDDEGHVTIVYNVSDSATTFGTIYPSIGYISARTTQAPGTFYGTGTYLVLGSAAYCQLDSKGRNRWGDYTAASPLGSAATYPGFWFAGEFSESSTSACSTLLGTPCWGTAIGKNAYTSETQP